VLKLDGYPSALAPADRLLKVDGMPVGLPVNEHGIEPGLLVESAGYEPGEGFIVTVWGATQMFELRLAANTPISWLTDDVLAAKRAQLHATAVAEADPSDDETCDECGVHRGHENDCPANPYNLDDPIDLADAASGNMTPGSEY
jgi:hypothetical protein